MRKRKQIPRFKSEEAERRFWARHDSTEYVAWSTGKRTRFPELKPSARTISVRMPEFLIEELKVLSNKRGIPYQSLLKQFLAERIERELAAH